MSFNFNIHERKYCFPTQVIPKFAEHVGVCYGNAGTEWLTHDASHSYTFSFRIIYHTYQ